MVASVLVLAAGATGACSADEAGTADGGDPPVVATDGSEATTPAGPDGAAGDEQAFPAVVGVEATAAGGDAVRFDVTISSPYDSPTRYADAWRVLGPDGAELGVRVLTHDHAAEQPFTRSETIDVPPDVVEVTVQGRDLVNGWGGATMTVALPER